MAIDVASKSVVSSSIRAAPSWTMTRASSSVRLLITCSAPASTRRGERPEGGPADKYRSSAHDDRRRNVLPRPDATVGVDLRLITNRRDDLWQGTGSTGRRTKAASAVRGDNDACRSGVDTTSSVVSSKHTLHEYRKTTQFTQPADGAEVDRGITVQTGWSCSGLLIGRQVDERLVLAVLSGQFRGFTLAGSGAIMSTVNSRARAPFATARSTRLSVRPWSRVT